MKPSRHRVLSRYRLKQAAINPAVRRLESNLVERVEEKLIDVFGAVSRLYIDVDPTSPVHGLELMNARDLKSLEGDFEQIRQDLRSAIATVEKAKRTLTRMR